MTSRKPIKIKRKPITVYTDKGWFSGGWHPFPKPEEQAPYFKNVKRTERILWCPWCAEWTIFRHVHGADRKDCTGVCGWANDHEHYVRTYNDLWWEK